MLNPNCTLLKVSQKFDQFLILIIIYQIISGVHHGFFNHPVLMKNSFTESQLHIGNFLKKF